MPSSHSSEYYSSPPYPQEKSSTIFPSQKAIKTLPVANYTPATPVITSKITSFTYSPSKGATTTLPISTSDNGGANPSYISTTGLSSSTVFHSANYSKIGNAVTSNRIKPSSYLSGSTYISGGRTRENGLDQESNETMQNDQIEIINAYLNSLPPEELKLSTDTLILINPDFPVFTHDSKQNIYDSLVYMNVLIPADQLGYQGEIVGDVVGRAVLWVVPVQI